MLKKVEDRTMRLKVSREAAQCRKEDSDQHLRISLLQGVRLHLEELKSHLLFLPTLLKVWDVILQMLAPIGCRSVVNISNIKAKVSINSRINSLLILFVRHSSAKLMDRLISKQYINRTSVIITRDEIIPPFHASNIARSECWKATSVWLCERLMHWYRCNKHKQAEACVVMAQKQLATEHGLSYLPSWQHQSANCCRLWKTDRESCGLEIMLLLERFNARRDYIDREIFLAHLIMVMCRVQHFIEIAQC